MQSFMVNAKNLGVVAAMPFELKEFDNKVLMKKLMLNLNEQFRLTWLQPYIMKIVGPTLLAA